MKKTIVIGAGGAGLASALLASARNEDVTLLEAHENVGGCASWFHRKDFCFDVGATTVSGVTNQGPLGKLFKMLESKPILFHQDPGIVFHLSNGKKVSYRCDFEKWMQELEAAFPHLNHRPFWFKVYKINSKAWDLLSKLSSFPFQNILEALDVFKSPELFPLYPYLIVNTEMMLKSYGLYDKDYLELLNGILLISAQAHAEHVPFLVGAMALAYPQETYAPQGGMKGFMTFFEHQCEKHHIKLIKNAPVHKIEKRVVSYHHEKLAADKIILNVPYWNIPDLFSDLEGEKLKKELIKTKHAWGAFTLYLGVKGDIQDIYQQVHLNHEDVANYFVSFSLPQDRDRAPEGWQAVTISTHVEVADWMGLSLEAYKEKKKHFIEIILTDFKNRFGIIETKYITAGTPKTFERYTLRKSGYVGGLPFLYGMNPLSLEGHTTHLENIYRVGDTTFPGQGLVGVVAGAFALDEQIKKSI